MNASTGISSVLIAAALAAPSLAANQVFVVATAAGPGVDFTNVQTAINAAGEGDVLLLKSGSYFGNGAPPNLSFSVSNKSLTLLADNGASVKLFGTFSISNLVVGRQVTLRGITFDSTDNGTALQLNNDFGSLWIEDCTFKAGSTAFPFAPAGDGAAFHNCSSVMLTRCSLTGASIVTSLGPGFDGLQATGSNVCAYDCTFNGGSGSNGSNLLIGGDGARIDGGFFFASASTFKGGKGGNGGVLFPLGCTDGAAGGHGLHLVSSGAGSPSASTHGCTLLGGAGGSSGGAACSSGVAGAGIKIDNGAHSTLTGSVHHFTTTAAPREGQVLSKLYTGTPGEFVFIDFGVNQGFAYFPEYRGVLGLGSPYFTHFQGVIDAAGTLSKPSTINELGAGVEGVPLYTQAVFYNTSTGILYASTPSVTVLLDSSL